MRYPATITRTDGNSHTISNERELSDWTADQKEKFIRFDYSNEQFFGIGGTPYKKKDYFLIFMGRSGVGKTTLLEFFLNILTGQMDSPKSLRLTKYEETVPGKSKTQKVCRYRIEYFSDQNKFQFSITLIDTPGFLDTAGADKDKEHIKTTLNEISNLERIHGFIYVVSGALTRKTLEPLQSISNVFSYLKRDALENVSTIITFCDNLNQASNRIKIENPFHIPQMKKLVELKEAFLDWFNQLLEKNTSCGVAEAKLSDFKDVEAPQIRHLISKDWLKQQKCKLNSEGKAIRKVPSTEKWSNGGVSTVCMSSDCRPNSKEVCDEGCKCYLPIKNVAFNIRDCRTFRNMFMIRYDECFYCGCKYSLHIHSEFKMMWVEDDEITAKYNEAQEQDKEIPIKTKELEKEISNIAAKFREQIEDVSKLKQRLQQLDAGDIQTIVDDSMKKAKHHLNILENQSPQPNEGIQQLKDLLEKLKTFIHV
ncbi:hypothetical protein DFA_01783 [Cavenderia fasciculata]|uniref:G domain-containing protein n=1 Tax=Cavenderia fasciculata TaxID=261658 RepID=F4PUN3_CACFS|nr:uncharacterized protein DFA_01783 [Cavenderia fasciculata]EGG21897.1 hypothetical protein DFA_01783 [Cavenderia fasciculata]|eukprot:XP_004359748.1 hypothetical protein DFA_01783 [Cavenderia fasciculata]